VSEEITVVIHLSSKSAYVYSTQSFSRIAFSIHVCGEIMASTDVASEVDGL
jgi:hypothetical protein